MPNLANLLTLLRMFLSLVLYIILLSGGTKQKFIICLVIFIVASLTDFFDGLLARKDNRITDFGKIFDPTADKILVFFVLLAFLKLNLLNEKSIICATMLLIREFIMSSIRQILAMNSIQIFSDIWGKIKTTLQMFSICIIMISQFYKSNFNLLIVGNYVFIFSVLIAWISPLICIKKNKDKLKFYL
ncbi:MAG: CDP-diacylglycerol--glycerol-3-phosphate 3-phosphatidyltransferase [Oscillospiraceae bacterium]|jgi:CDP-diacylglycerol--glycerol-3-phosphate 3-phosphatidyltransferase|nr:CDP-diacylglycerol--glycerol-3-phosphate 3-phosphatidyltransferase [Oscillospiraceae bacterium]